MPLDSNRTRTSPNKICVLERYFLHFCWHPDDRTRLVLLACQALGCRNHQSSASASHRIPVSGGYMVWKNFFYIFPAFQLAFAKVSGRVEFGSFSRAKYVPTANQSNTMATGWVAMPEPELEVNLCSRQEIGEIFMQLEVEDASRLGWLFLSWPSSMILN